MAGSSTAQKSFTSIVNSTSKQVYGSATEIPAFLSADALTGQNAASIDLNSASYFSAAYTILVKLPALRLSLERCSSSFAASQPKWYKSCPSQRSDFSLSIRADTFKNIVPRKPSLLLFIDWEYAFLQVTSAFDIGQLACDLVIEEHSDKFPSENTFKQQVSVCQRQEFDFYRLQLICSILFTTPIASSLHNCFSAKISTFFWHQAHLFFSKLIDSLVACTNLP